MAHAEVGQCVGVRVNWDRRQLRSSALVARGDFLKIGLLHRFTNFYTLRV